MVNKQKMFPLTVKEDGKMKKSCQAFIVHFFFLENKEKLSAEEYMIKLAFSCARFISLSKFLLVI